MLRIFAKKKKTTEWKCSPLYEKNEEKQKELIEKHTAKFDPTEIEIYALTIRDSHVEGGAHQVFSISNWMYAFTMDNTLYNESLLLTFYSSDREKAEDIKNVLGKNQIVKLRVRIAKDNPVRKSFLLVEILDAHAQNEPLKELLDEIQKGKTLHDDKWGNLLFNPETYQYEGAVDWCGDRCSLFVAYRNEEFLRENIETAHYLIDHQQDIMDALIERIREFPFAEYQLGKLDKHALVEDLHAIKITIFTQLDGLYRYTIDLVSEASLHGLIIEVEGTYDLVHPIRIIDPDTGMDFE